MNKTIIDVVARKTNIGAKYVESVLVMAQEGSTIPFIARYRKEKTNNLDEEQIRAIIQNFEYESKLAERIEAVINLIKEKGKLTEELHQQLLNATTLSEVEDLYLPYKEKKKTRASIAISKGLEPLAIWLLQGNSGDVQVKASEFINDTVENTSDALKGASDIIAEMISDNHKNRQALRNFIRYFGQIQTKIKKDAVDEKKVFEVYYNHREPIRSIVNHRVLAIDRGENLKILKVEIEVPDADILKNLYNTNINNPNVEGAFYVKAAIEDSYNRLLFPSIENEVRNELTERAQEKAIEVFALNLEQLLLLPPIKNKVILGVDPAFRTGCKLCVVNGNGDFMYKDVIYPHEKYIGETVNVKRIEEAMEKIALLVKKYQVELIAIGNGTASRETEEFIATTIKNYSLNTKYIIVSEAGASVYSASENAKKEFPEFAVEERSAVSIARRVLDPLAELIKIEPKSIGVGQYQHDVNQNKLGDSLDFTISKVVNNVGVNINTASSELLSYVSGLSKKTSSNIIEYRKEKGKIKTREEVKKIKGIGDKGYEQAIGFIKILESNNPLDKTFIHPESYDKVEKLLKDLGLNIKDIGTNDFIASLNTIDSSVANKYGIDTFSFNDIKLELTKPLRDIRDDYPTPVLRSDILHIEDLKAGMKLQGSVRSVVDFGVFVDIGLKNDGMIHRSKLSKNRINHPLDVVSIGDILEVYVLEVDLQKQKVALSLFSQN